MSAVYFNNAAIGQTMRTCDVSSLVKLLRMEFIAHTDCGGGQVWGNGAVSIEIFPL